VVPDLHVAGLPGEILQQHVIFKLVSRAPKISKTTLRMKDTLYLFVRTESRLDGNGHKSDFCLSTPKILRYGEPWQDNHFDSLSITLT
jgi:hypothetical protein